MKKKDSFRDLEPWILWLLYTIKNDLKPLVQEFLKDHSLKTNSDFEWLKLCKDALLKGDPKLSIWVQKTWLFSKRKIASLSQQEAIDHYGPSACLIFYSLSNTHETAVEKLKKRALSELKEQKFLQVQEKLVLIEEQYEEDVAQLRQEVDNLQNQRLGCCGSR